MARLLRARGGDPDGHVSRPLTGQLMAQADLVLTFEFAQHMRILEAHPGSRDRLFGLLQFADVVGRISLPANGAGIVREAHMACAPDSMTWDVADPYRRGAAAAKRAADEIDRALAVIVPALAGRRS